MRDEITALYFSAPRTIEFLGETIPVLKPGQLCVKTLVSAISPGTEMLVYRGEIPQDVQTDSTIAALSGDMHYPLKYGYASVGQVIDTRSSDEHDLAQWNSRFVFSFQPHQTHFLATSDELIPLPEGIPPEQAIFLPNMETAVNFVMDGQPLIGERVAILGQGIVGLLTTALLSQFPLTDLTTFDHFPLRRTASLKAGATSSLAEVQRGSTSSSDFPSLPFDLTYELTGSPHALNDAIAATGFDGRVVIGSWYGQKRAQIDLGGYFHRSRIRLISSQVSSLAPQFTGRWNKARRFKVAWEMIRRVKPERWITHQFPFEQGEKAYNLVDQHPETTIQVILKYS